MTPRATIRGADKGVPHDHKKTRPAGAEKRFDKYRVSVEMAVPNRSHWHGLHARRTRSARSILEAGVGHAHIRARRARARELEAL